MSYAVAESQQHVKIAVLGAGNIGTVIAHTLAQIGHDVAIWDHFPDVVEDIRRNRTNRRFLPGVELHTGINSCANAGECIAGASLVVISVPSIFLVPTVIPLVPLLEKESILLNVAKGFAPVGHELIPTFLGRLAPSHPCVHLAGPAIANELARGVAAFITLAAEDEFAARRVAKWFAGSLFIPTTTADMVGAALGGIFKNVYAILLGCLDSLSGGARNLEAAAVTACLDEMVKIAAASGGQRATLYSIAGLGDLVATGFSNESHNRKFGRMLASGKSAGEIEKESGWLPEGARATAAVCELAREKQVEAPLAKWVLHLLDGAAPTLDGLIRALRSTQISSIRS